MDRLNNISKHLEHYKLLVWFFIFLFENVILYCCNNEHVPMVSLRRGQGNVLYIMHGIIKTQTSSHWSMHGWWNSWRQAGSVLTFSPASNSERQTTHLQTGTYNRWSKIHPRIFQHTYALLVGEVDISRVILYLSQWELVDGCNNEVWDYTVQCPLLLPSLPSPCGLAGPSCSASSSNSCKEKMSPCES